MISQASSAISTVHIAEFPYCESPQQKNNLEMIINSFSFESWDVGYDSGATR